MKRSIVVAGLSAVVGLGVAWRVKSGIAAKAGRSPSGADRHLAVTVLRDPEEVAPEGRLPERLAALADRADITVRPAPGDRGTEVHAVVREPDDGDDRAVAREVRTALREVKALLETGEVLSPDRPGTAHPTVANAPLRKATAAARGEGVS
jgi:hypothetical protein